MSNAWRATRVAAWLMAGALVVPASAWAADDDDPEEVAHELAEKVAKAMERARKAQEKAAKKAAKAREEAAEDAEEAREEAEEEREEALEKLAKARKDRHAQARFEARPRMSPAELEEDYFDEFGERVEDYVKVHNQEVKRLTEPPAAATPEVVVAYVIALRKAIRARRPAPRPGNIFVRECQPAFKRLLAAELAGRAGTPARKAVLEGNPPLEIDNDDRMVVKVWPNAAYPMAAPVSTVPPSVLLTLPLLPPEVEYRFVGRHLVLLDVAANLIVDYIPSAAPPLTPAPAQPAPARPR